MEKVDMDPEEESEPALLAENQEPASTVSTQDIEEDPNTQTHEKFNEAPSESQEEVGEESEKLILPQRMINLQRDLTTSVSNNQTAADAKESMRRNELEESRKIRSERLKNNVKSSEKIFQEITTGWSKAKQKELKVRNDQFVKDLRKQEENLDLTMESFENEIQTLTLSYKEELAHILGVNQQATEVFLTKEQTDWQQRLKLLSDQEHGWLMQWKKTMEECEANVHSQIWATVEKDSNMTELNAASQAQKRKKQKMKAKKEVTALQSAVPEVTPVELRRDLNRMEKRVGSLQKEIKTLRGSSSTQKQEFQKTTLSMSKDHKRSIEKYENVKRRIKHFALADARQYEDMWLTVDEEVRQLADRALAIDSQICELVLGISWERPPMEFMELSGPRRPQEGAGLLHAGGRAPLCGQRTTDLSVGPRAEAGTESRGETARGEGDAEAEEGKISAATLKKVLELLCDKAGFLVENKLLNLLAPLEEEEQTVVKLASLLCTFGLEEEDVPKLAEFLLKYKPQQKDQTEDVCVESGESSVKAEGAETESATHLTSELIDPNHVMPALKVFLEQHLRSRESSARLNEISCDPLDDEAYWERMGNIIPEDRVKLWEPAEKSLKQHLAVLKDISEVVPEIQSLEKENRELRMLLQQHFP
uniref:dynein regulatory complex protein 1 isoform X2 n=1 Tax=Gasterosteus aculeatus aculeatus TaxID=481459 RepID=UPI001A99DA68|nr:dynein regulatory complex protein 1 isoform X2 [Gasterosteus aculeatus aculeatus]